MTVDTYGRWLPTGDKGYVDALDGTEGKATEARGGGIRHGAVAVAAAEW